MASELQKQLKFRDLKKLFGILSEEVGDRLNDAIVAVDLESLIEEIIHRIIVETVTKDPEIVNRIERHIRGFIDKFDD